MTLRLVTLMLVTLCARVAQAQHHDDLLSKAIDARIAELKAEKAAMAALMFANTTLLGSSENDACDAATTCDECLAQQGCRWCVETTQCYSFMNANCPIPLNAASACATRGYPYQLVDFTSLRPDAALQWLTKTAAALKRPQPALPTYNGTGSSGVFDLATGADVNASAPVSSGGGPVTLAVAADWATGTYEADTVGKLMAAENADWTIHLGDTYYVGDEDEANTNYLGVAPLAGENRVGVRFPNGSVGKLAIPGNHEYIAGGSAYFEKMMPDGYTGGASKKVQQRASYAALVNDHWRVLLLDTGYDCYCRCDGKDPPHALPADPCQAHDDACKGKEKGSAILDILSLNLYETHGRLPPATYDWLQDNKTLQLHNASDTRGIMILTHHQPFSTFGGAYPFAAQQLDTIIPKGRSVAWFWGHQHRLALFRELSCAGGSCDGGPAGSPGPLGFSYHGRLIGNAGFPNDFDGPSANRNASAVIAFDGRAYAREQLLPPLLTQEVGFNGYFTVKLDGDTATVAYKTVACVDAEGNAVAARAGSTMCKGPPNGLPLSSTESSVMAKESFTVQADGSVKQKTLSISDAMTRP